MHRSSARRSLIAIR